MAKNIFIIQDDGTGTEPCTYGIIETENSGVKLQNDIDEYKESDEVYNFDDLEKYLKARGYKFLKYKEVYF